MHVLAKALLAGCHAPLSLSGSLHQIAYELMQAQLLTCLALLSM